jgi:phenylpyruvate tautomerase
MPLVRIVSSAAPPPAPDALLTDLSALLAHELGKPEAYVMTCLEPRASMTFAGTDAPSCLVEVKNIGVLGPDLTRRLSAAITARLVAAFRVPSDRVYIEFVEVRAHHWGHDGGTFA